MTSNPQQPGNTVVLPPVRRRRWLRILLGIAIFVAGMVVGSGLTIKVAVNRIQYAIRHPEEAPHRITNQLRRRLSLSDQQAQQVSQIIARHQASLLAIRRDVQPKVERELEDTFQEIKAVLTPEQAAKWQTLVRNLRENWMPPALQRPAR